MLVHGTHRPRIVPGHLPKRVPSSVEGASPIPEEWAAAGAIRTNSFVFSGASVPTPLSVVRWPSITSTPYTFDVSDKSKYSDAYRKSRRSEEIRKCLVHTNAGSLDTDIIKVYKYCIKRSFTDAKNGQAAAHLYIEADGSIHQFFDLAIPVVHSSYFGPYNASSVSVEFVVPASAPDKKTFNRKVLSGPWPALPDDFKFAYTRDAAGLLIYNVRSPPAYTFSPNDAQFDTFALLALALHKSFGIPLGAVPSVGPHTIGTRERTLADVAPSPAGVYPPTIVRSTDIAVQGAMYETEGWGFFHHCQVETNRVDAIGADLPTLLARARGDQWPRVLPLFGGV